MDNQNDNNISSDSGNDIKPAPAPSKIFGIISMVMGILTIISCGTCGILAIPGIILGIISRRKQEEPKAFAIVGIITSAVGIVVGILFLVLGGIAFVAGYLNM